MIEKYLNPRNTGFVISVLKSGAFDGAKSVVLESVYNKYLFNCGEGTYRCLQDCNLNHLKIEDILITHKSWENVGGLYGMLVSRFGTLLNQSKGWSKKRSPLLEANGMVNIHGPPEVEKVLLETVNPDLDHSGFIDVLAYTQKHEISGGSYSNFQMEIEYVKIPKSASLQSDTKEIDSDFSVAYVIRPKPKWKIDNSRLNALGIAEKCSWKSEILKKESRRRDKVCI